MAYDFKGKTAIVTGGGSGIGAAISRHLARDGATVIVADLNMEHAEKIAKEIGGHAFEVDTANPEMVEAMVGFAVQKTGALHHIVNNAGITGPVTPLVDYPLDKWDQVIGINLNGVFYGMRYALPEIEKSGGGSIVNTASMLGAVGSPNTSAYVATKHGVVGLTKAAALEYAAKGIRINAIGPGTIHTLMMDTSMTPEQIDGIANMQPIKRLGTPDEVAALTCFLLSDTAGFITGGYYLVDGGYTAE